MKSVPIFIGTILLAILAMDPPVQAAPQFDMLGGIDFLAVCINNCAQCKKLYGAFFEGKLCADACIQFRGRVVPDCEDIGSIAPFLNKLEIQ
ncbi:AAEL014409-PA [Aedes aegypti]|uniref:Eclosion hormone n=1 Tax=Aedes aegypti TaxID=7159 RepID=Q16GE3_AEDAE|nr:AAEL014409-PA [Aedes aegypti]